MMAVYTEWELSNSEYHYVPAHLSLDAGILLLQVVMSDCFVECVLLCFVMSVD